MKVVFWNTMPMSGDITGYVAAVGTILHLEYSYNVVLGSNYISNHMLQDCFLSRIKEEGIAHAPYQYLYDSKEYYSALWNLKKKFQRNILEIPMDGVKVIFPPDVSEKQVFYYKASPSAFYLLEFAGDSNDYFRCIVDEAEVVVVFLPQNVAEIQKFFHRFSSIIPKAIFVISEVRRSSRSFFKNYVANYGIKYRDIGSIPKNDAYLEACVEGKIVSFLEKHHATKHSAYKFVSSIKNIARRLNECYLTQYQRSEESGDL